MEEENSTKKEDNLEKKSEKILEKREKKIINWFKNKYNLALFSLVVFAIAIRIYYFFLTYNQPLWWDEAEYMVIAKAWASGTQVTLDPVRQVLFPFIISLFLKIANNEFFPKLFLFLLSTASVIGTYLLGKEMFDKKIGLFAGFLMSIFYMNLFFSIRILVDIHSLAFFAFAAFFFYKYLANNSKKDLYIAAVVIAIGTMFKLSTAYLLFSILIYLLITEKLNFLKKREIWISALIFWLVISPYIIWGYFTFHGFVLAKAASAVTPANIVASGFNSLKTYIIYFPTYIFSLDWSKVFSPTWYFLILALIALSVITFYRLFMGFDLLLKNKDPDKEKNQKRDLYLLLIMVIPLILVSFMINHYEDRYSINMFPAFFIMIGVFVIGIFNFLKNKKLISLAFIFLVIVLCFFAYASIKFSDNSIKNKITSYSQVKDAGLWFKENSELSDVMVTVSVSQVKYYSDREIIKIPDTKEEFETETIPKKHPKYFMLSGFEQGPEWSRSYPEEKNLSLANVFFIDAAKTQPIVIIYNLPASN